MTIVIGYRFSYSLLSTEAGIEHYLVTVNLKLKLMEHNQSYDEEQNQRIFQVRAEK